MSGTLRLRGATSGYSELQAPAVAADQTFILPTAGGTLLTTDSPIPKLTLELGSAAQPSLTFEGDTDTGLYSSGTNTLNLVTGGNNRITINSAGSVGINQTNPNNTLDVNGGFHVDGLSVFDDVLQVGGDAQVGVAGVQLFAGGSITVRNNFASNDVFRAQVVGSSAYKIALTAGGSATFAGRVNAGTSGVPVASDNAISAINNGSAPTIYINNQGVGTTSIEATGGATFAGRTDIGTTSLDNYSIAAFSNSATNGGVYVQNDNASGKLFVGQSGGVEVITLESDGSASFVGNLKLQHTGKFILTEGTTNAFSISTNGANGNLIFRDEYNNSDRMQIDSSGQLLLGTTAAGFGNAADNLTIADNGNCGMTIRSASGFVGSLYFADGVSGAANYAGFVDYQHSVDALRFGTGGGQERMRIQSNGRVLIGKTATNFAVQGIELRENGEVVCTREGDIITTRRLNTEGTHFSFRNISGSYVGTIVTTSSSTAYNESSDYRLKENVVNLNNAITRVKQLQPRRFNFIVNPNTTVDGFLAHEAQQVVPEAVTGEKNGEEMQGIDKSKLVPLLTAALQEAITKIETLETKVAALEAG